MRKVVLILLILSLVLAVVPTLGEEQPVSIGIVYKQTGNPYFEVAIQGFKEAQEELNFTFIHNGPSDSSNEGQIQIIEGYIQRGVDVIAIAANDAAGCANVLQMAMEQGIAVVSFDSRVNSEGRCLHVDAVEYYDVACALIQEMSRQINGEGQIAILSASATMDNQNSIIAYILDELKKEEYVNIELVTIVYGDDITDKSYQETQGLIDSYPNLKGIISPTSIGIAAAAICIQDNERTGQVKLTGLGLPSEMVDYVLSGVCEGMYLWNPIDLGYCAAYACYNLVRGTMQAEIGTSFECGRLGRLEIKDEGKGNPFVVTGAPLYFDAKNINEWKEIF